MIETNSFKNLVHLSLTFTAGNDAMVKEYLAGCLKDEKEAGARLRHELERLGTDTTAQLQRSDEMVDDKEREIRRLQNELTTSAR